MELQLAREQDIPRIMELIEKARVFFQLWGVDQWQHGYPNRARIETDIQCKTGYLCIHCGEAIGYVCVSFDSEPTYEKIEGSWLKEEPYGVVHRLALDNRVKGQGLASQVFALAENLCRSRNINSLRIDTHRDNKIMRHLMEKNGFAYCGIIQVQDGKRMAFQKLL